MAPSSPPPPRSITPDRIILLAKDPTATLPTSVPDATLISFLHDHPSNPTYALSLFTLLCRSRSRLPSSSLLPSLLLSHLPSLHPHLDLLPTSLALSPDPLPALDALLAAPWPSPLLVKLVSLLRDLPPLARPRFPLLLAKALDSMPSADLQDLPSLAYHLLVLASRGFPRRDVVRGVLGFFGRGAVKGSPAVVRQVEATVLMHVSFAVKHDPSLAHEALAVVRSGVEGVVSHFAVLVVMAIARVRRFGESALGSLRSVVVTAYRDCRFSRRCRWIPEEVKEECLRDAKRIEDSLTRAASESSIGREHVVPSLVQFGFLLLESVDHENCKWIDNFDGFLGVEELGIRMLRMLFEVHDMARNEIIEQCKFRILGLKPQQSLSIIKLLADLARHFPYPMLDHVARLKELLDYFAFMSDKTALATTLAILPLTKFTHELQDYIILVVRKALFRREDTIRLAATNVVMELILEESKYRKKGLNSLQDSSSQASSSQQTDISSRMGLGLFQELNGLLRRCLSQEARIKEVVYHGLLKLVTVDPSAAGAVLEFLWPHFLQFYKEDMAFPLQIHDCIKLVNDRVYHEEPLDSLLSCISSILLLQPRSKAKGARSSEISRAFLGFSLSQEVEEARTSFSEKFSDVLSSIRKALRSVNLEDIFCHRESSACPLQGEKRGYFSWMLSGITEVFIDMAVLEMKNVNAEKQDLEVEVLELVSLHESLEKAYHSTKRHVTRKGSRKIVEASVDGLHDGTKDVHGTPLLKLTEARKPFISTSGLHRLLDAAFAIYGANNICSGSPCQRNGQTSCHMTLEQCFSFISFSVKAFHRQVKSMLLSRVDGPLKTMVDEDITLMSRPLFQAIWLMKSGCNLEGGEKKKEAKGKKVAHRWEDICTSLACLNELFKLCPNKASFFGIIENLASLNLDDNEVLVHDNANDEGDSEVNVQEPAADIFLMKKLKPLYSEFLELSHLHECEILSDILLMVGDKVKNKLRDSLGVWAGDLCRWFAMENPKMARRMAGLAISLNSPPKDLSIAQFMALELLKLVGSDAMKKSETCPIINDSTAMSISSELLQLIESVLVDLDWTLTKLKSFTINDSGNIDSEKNCIVGEKSVGVLLEEALFARSEALAHLLAYFAEMDLKDPQVELLLKLTAKFYKIMAGMAKLHIAPKGCKQVIPGQKFQKLTEVTCKMLTTPLYNFLAFTQQKQQETTRVRGIRDTIKKENKCIPELIYQIEDYEKYLIKLGKLTKVNLMRNAKRSTVRDFRIYAFEKNGAQERVAAHDPSEANAEEARSDSPTEHERPVKRNGHSYSENEEPVERNGHLEELLQEECDSGASGTEASALNEDDNGMVIKAKRAKLSKVVQDSDEEG